MSVIIDNSAEDDVVKANVPTSRELDKSIQLYQQIYQHITGTTEKTKYTCSDNLLIDLDEIKQIHNKINQLCDMHHIISSNETVTVLHSKDRKEQFTSFEKFVLLSGANASPTTNVILKYNYAICPANTNKPNHYVITVRLTSRIAMQKEMEESAPPFIRGRIVTFMIADAAEITVEYADYIVARSFVEAFKDWSDGCKRVSQKTSLIQKIQPFSHFVPLVMKFLFSVLVFIYTYIYVDKYINLGGGNELLVKFLMLSFGGFFIIPSIAKYLGRNIEMLIDRYTPLSYIILNKGDERLYDEYQKKNNSSVKGTLLNVVLTIVLGVISAKLDKLI